jgi:hypothetical protein
VSLRGHADVLDELDEHVRAMARESLSKWMRRQYALRTRKLLEELRRLLLETDAEVWDAHDPRKRARKCASCGGTMPSTVRRDAVTCGQVCRQRRARKLARQRRRESGEAQRMPARGTGQQLQPATARR